MCKYIFKPIYIHTHIYKQNQCDVYTHTHILLLLFIYQYIKRFLYLLVYKYSFLFIYTQIFINIIRKWLMQLWKLLSLKICSWQARVPENWWWGSSLKAGWAEISASVQVWRQGRKKKSIQTQAVRQRPVPSPSAFLFSLLYSDLHLIGWNPPTLRRAKSGLLSLPIQMLISSRNIFTDISRKTFDQISGHPMAQSSWHIKLTFRRYQKDFVLITWSLW